MLAKSACLEEWVRASNKGIVWMVRLDICFGEVGVGSVQQREKLLVLAGTWTVAKPNCLCVGTHQPTPYTLDVRMRETSITLWQTARGFETEGRFETEGPLHVGSESIPRPSNQRWKKHILIDTFWVTGRA